MSVRTRVVHLGALVDRDEAYNDKTRVFPSGPCVTPVEKLFERHHAEMADALEGEPQPGLMVFALSSLAIEGSMWLSASEGLRAGSIGRHGCTDLHLPQDQGMSLRQCLMLVRKVNDCVRSYVVDLDSAAGLETEDYEAARAVEASGHFFLRVPGCLLACFPTGCALPWERNAEAPFATLRPRIVELTDVGADRRSGSLTIEPGPVDGARQPLCLPGERPAGVLTIRCGPKTERISVGASALDCGITLGRDGRCAGWKTLQEDRVSRVHALLLSRDDVLYVADAGSTNGTWEGEREIRCAEVRSGIEFGLRAAASFSGAPAL